MSVVDAVTRDVEALRRRSPDLADSALAATALAMAAEIDRSGNSATSKSMCSRVLADVMGELRALAPPEEQKDRVDDLNARREKRRQRPAGA